jgi:DNA-binding transcriptional regulator PaaX
LVKYLLADDTGWRILCRHGAENEVKEVEKIVIKEVQRATFKKAPMQLAQGLLMKPSTILEAWVTTAKRLSADGKIARRNTWF